VDILVLAYTAVLCGMKDYEDIEEFGREKLKWFKEFLELPHGIPDAITFYRVLRLVEPVKLAEGLQAWLYEIKLQAGYEVNIDGKTIRGSIRANFRGVHIVSAYVGACGLTLGQVRTEAHSNEITAIPMLLEMLDIRGAKVTIDAEGCQKAIAEKIVEKEADYTLAVKGNQPELYEQVKDCFDWAEQDKSADIAVEEHKSGSEKDHGRIERRECSVITDIDWLYQKEQWKNMRSIIKVRRSYQKWDTKQDRWQDEIVEDRYFISSLALSAKEMAGIIRRHWSVENQLHWVLDVAFGEDDDMKKTLNAPENMNVMRKIALAAILRHDPEKKKSIKHNMTHALLNDDDRLSLLFGP
jgi:predicted transposase YbfD/YdcC